MAVETPHGSVTAERGVLGLGAWSASLSRFRRAIVPRGTYIVVTEPAPERLAEIGWTGGEGLADWRTAVRYFRTTPDGRIAFGAAAATAGAGVGLGPRLRYDGASIVKLVDDFRRFFPSWSDVAIEAAWGGPMDVTGRHTALPLVDLEPMRFPPEPLRSFGAALTQHAIVRKDEQDDLGRRADPLTSFIARLPRRMGYELGP